MSEIKQKYDMLHKCWYGFNEDKIKYHIVKEWMGVDAKKVQAMEKP